MSPKCDIWYQSAKIWGPQKFLFLAEISAIFTPNGAFSSKKLGKFRKIVKNSFFQKCVKFIFRPLFHRKCVPEGVFCSKVAISTKEKWLIFEITFFPQISCSPHHWPICFCSFFVEICFFFMYLLCAHTLFWFESDDKDIKIDRCSMLNLESIDSFWMKID